jgi:hypothetical protein
MTGFEKSTLTWARTAVIMSGLAAIFVCAQWYEMHESGTDTHNLALAALAANRAWLAPEQMILASPLESEVPPKYQIRVVNPGREPALGITWQVNPRGVPYIPEGNASDFKLGPNTACTGLEPEPTDGMVIYPAGPTNIWLPLAVKDTTENRELIKEALNRTKSLVVEGCFAYRTGGEKHTSSFRFFLRDVLGPSFIKDKNGNLGPAWNFNATPTGNEAN